MSLDIEQRRWKHVKRGTEYVEIGRAELQMSFDSLVDGSSMVVYRGEDGRLWVREESEFEDGRFEVSLSTPTSSGGSGDRIAELNDQCAILAADRMAEQQRRIAAEADRDKLREALEQIANGQAFREQRFFEDDDAEYFLRAQRNAQAFARIALTPARKEQIGEAS